MANSNRLIAKLSNLAEHLRYCGRCHMDDVMACDHGRALWIDAGMPTEGLSKFADGKMGCGECGVYWANGVEHTADCSQATTARSGEGKE